MAISPEQLLARAQEQLESADELNFRDAAKNAYYAAYHLLKPLEAAINDPVKYGDGSHAQLIGVLANHDIGPVKSLGYMLRDCRLRRNQADYDIDDPFPRELAQLQVETVVRIFAKHRDVVGSGVIELP